MISERPCHTKYCFCSSQYAGNVKIIFYFNICCDNILLGLKWGSQLSAFNYFEGQLSLINRTLPLREWEWGHDSSLQALNFIKYLYSQKKDLKVSNNFIPFKLGNYEGGFKYYFHNFKRLEVLFNLSWGISQTYTRQ